MEGLLSMRPIPSSFFFTLLAPDIKLCDTTALRHENVIRKPTYNKRTNCISDVDPLYKYSIAPTLPSLPQTGLRMPIILFLALLASTASTRQDDFIILVTGGWADATSDYDNDKGLVLSSTEVLGNSCPVPSLP